MLAAEGFEIIPNADWRESILYERENPRIAVLDAPYQSIYGHRTRIEFLLILGERQILVEAKRQSSSGSVDEKLPYVFLNALENMPEREFVFVMDGEGWREGARAWIEARAAETPGFTVLAPDELSAWLAAPLCETDAAPGCVERPR